MKGGKKLVRKISLPTASRTRQEEEEPEAGKWLRASCMFTGDSEGGEKQTSEGPPGTTAGTSQGLMGGNEVMAPKPAAEPGHPANSNLVPTLTDG